ncbi:probable purine permease 10 [Diospyros lotus]|uniref:probable purine permease 10 n=1 Tax=Diospyros lotus TaxID=55363 RepID=UPI002254BADD|nr:probable purine permease 10 [Diospyros lotus]
MGDIAGDLQAQIHVQEGKEANSPEHANGLRNYIWWVRMAIYSVFVLFGQSVATLLGRLYYDKGGNSKWMATLVQPAGFPVLIPFLIFLPTKHQTENNGLNNAPSRLLLGSVFALLGIFLAAVCMLYSIGLKYLPASTFSLICASELGFNAFFSYFLNSQKFTPFIVNSLVLLTISSSLVFNSDDSSEPTKASKGRYAFGFTCTVAASAGYALILSLTQLFFRKILKTESFRVALQLIIYESLIATSAILVGLFASGEWKGLNKEMDEFELGKASYVMTLFWTAVSWEAFSVGIAGLIFEVSSLFSTVISTVGLPVVPILSVFIFHDKMDIVKIVALLLAIWGFVSFIYQHYIDDLEFKNQSNEKASGVSEVSLVERVSP